jgi:uncharacterized protein
MGRENPGEAGVMADAASTEITHDRDARRFMCIVEGQQCTLDYELSAEVMTITHVLVPGPVAGRGIAGSLMKAALESAREQRWRVVPQCPYAAAYLRRHPKDADLTASR